MYWVPTTECIGKGHTSIRRIFHFIDKSYHTQTQIHVKISHCFAFALFFEDSRIFFKATLYIYNNNKWWKGIWKNIYEVLLQELRKGIRIILEILSEQIPSAKEKNISIEKKGVKSNHNNGGIYTKQRSVWTWDLILLLVKLFTPLPFFNVSSKLYYNQLLMKNSGCALLLNIKTSMI